MSAPAADSFEARHMDSDAPGLSPLGPANWPAPSLERPVRTLPILQRDIDEAPGFRHRDWAAAQEALEQHRLSR
jgi:hypothetical protein